MTQHELSSVTTLLHGRYELDDSPRQGGFALVYRAFDTKMERRIALKRLKPERQKDSKWLERFRHEGRLLASIPSHPNVVQVYDVDTDPQHKIDYFTMEWIEGQSLNEWRLRHPINDRTLLLEIAIGICRGLEAIHNAGLIHGDVTMNNILLSNASGQLVPKLTDFGLSWHEDQGQPDVLGGTRKYLAPEQIIGGSLTFRTDIYAFGAVLFFLFTGEHYLNSVETSESDDISFAHLREAICNESPRVLDSAPQTLNELLLSLLEKDPNDRPQTIAQVRSYLQEIEAEYQKRGQHTQRLLSATKSEYLQPEDKIQTVNLSLYFSDRALKAAYDRLNPILSQYKSISAWTWQDDQELTWELFDADQGYDFYAYNDGAAQNQNEIAFKMIFAVDTNNEANSELRKRLIDQRDRELREKTLVFECIRQSNRPRLFVRNISLKPIETGIQQKGTLLLRVRFSREMNSVPTNVLTEIRSLPINIEPDPEVKQRLEHWRTYLWVWEKEILRKTYEVEYKSWRLEKGQATGRLWFSLTDKAEERWNIIRASQDESIDLRELDETFEIDAGWLQDSTHEEPNYIALGSIKKTSDKDGHYRILVELDDDALTRYTDQNGSLSVPKEGYLAYRAFGDKKQVDNQQKALQLLEQGKAANPRLGQFIFDASQAAYPENERVVLRPDEFLLSTLNENQRSTVEGALTASDLYLIWGPPGTGKTTVIAELCYQFAQRGERVLIASQANLAVDNALSKLVHHPSIVALRVGNEGRVEEEGKPFTEKQVVSTWFDRTAKEVDHRLLHMDENFDLFATFVDNDYRRLMEYLEMADQHGQITQDLENTYAQATQKLAQCQESLIEYKQKQESLRDIYSLLADTAQSLKDKRLPSSEIWMNWRSKVLNFIELPQYQDYLVNTAFALSIVETIQPSLADELINRILQRDDRVMLRHIQENRRESGLNRHRVTAALLLGDQLRELLIQHLNSLRPVEAYIHSLFSKIEEYQHLTHDIQLIQDISDCRWVLRFLTDTQPTITTLLQNYQVYRTERNQLQSIDAILRDGQAKINDATSRIESLQQRMSLQPQIQVVQDQLRDQLKKIASEESKLEPLQQNIASLSHKIEKQTSQTQALKVEEIKQRERLQGCRDVRDDLDAFLPEIQQWLDRPHSSPRIPGLILDALRDNRQMLTTTRTEDTDLEVLRSIRVLINDVVLKLQNIIPARYWKQDNRDKDQPVRKRLRALLDQKSDETWVPRETVSVLQNVKKILEECVHKATGLKTSQGLKQDKSWEECGDEFYVIRQFGDFIDRVIGKRELHLQTVLDQQASALQHSTHQIIQNVITSQEETLKQLQKDIRQGSDAIQLVQREYTAAHTRLLGERKKTLQGTALLPSLCSNIEGLLGKAFFANALESLAQSNDTTDFSVLAVQIEHANAQIAETFSSWTREFDAQSQVFYELERQQDTLELSKSQQKQTVSIVAKETKAAYSATSAALQRLSTSSDEVLSLVKESIAWLLDAITKHAVVDQEAFVSTYTKVIDTYQEHGQNLQIRLKQIISQPQFTKVNLKNYENVWREEMAQLEVEIAKGFHEIHEQVQGLGFDISLLTTTLDDLNIQHWKALHEHLIETIDQYSEVAQSLDSHPLIAFFQSSLLHAENEISLHVKRLITDSEQLVKSVGFAGREIEKYRLKYKDEHEWWDDIFASIPRRLRENLETTLDIHSPDFIKHVLNQVQSQEWKAEVQRQKALLNPSKALIKSWSERLKQRTSDDIANLRDLYIESANVVGVTCGQVNRINRLGNNRRDLRPFDVVIIDEVSKATPPELLLPMLKGKKIILVGDHKQLPPMIDEKSLIDIAEAQGAGASDVSHMKRSLFEGLYTFAPDVLKGKLTEQYRMPPPIMHAINQFYGDMLTGGHNRKHNLVLPPMTPEISIAWINTPRHEDYFEKREGSSYTNPSEVEAISKLLDQMNNSWSVAMKRNTSYGPKSVGLITFYMAQYKEFRSRFDNRYPALNLRIGTVDRFQGMERQVVIVSLVRNNAQGTIGFAKEPERINVAFSRAQELLVIVGCKSLFTQQAKKAGGATDSYGKVAYVVEHEGRTIDVSEFK